MAKTKGRIVSYGVVEWVEEELVVHEAGAESPNWAKAFLRLISKALPLEGQKKARTQDTSRPPAFKGSHLVRGNISMSPRGWMLRIVEIRTALQGDRGGVDRKNSEYGPQGLDRGHFDRDGRGIRLTSPSSEGGPKWENIREIRWW